MIESEKWIGFPKESKRNGKMSENRIQAYLGERKKEVGTRGHLSENKESFSGRMK